MAEHLGFLESRKILERHGIHMVPCFTIDSKAKLSGLADKINYPVIIKAFSPEIIHKTKEGFASFGISNYKELSLSYDNISQRLNQKKIRSFSVVVQEEIRGPEFIIGTKLDAAFGNVVVFGLGGIYTEVLNKVAMRICPLDEKAAKALVEEIAGQLLEETVKRDLSKIIVKLSKMAEKEKISEMDLNPIIINSDGVHIVDVRIIR